MNCISPAPACSVLPAFLAASGKGGLTSSLGAHEPTLRATFFILLALLFVLIVWEVLATQLKRREEKLFTAAPAMRKRMEPMLPVQEKIEDGDPFKSMLKEKGQERTGEGAPPPIFPEGQRSAPVPSFSTPKPAEEEPRRPEAPPEGHALSPPARPPAPHQPPPEPQIIPPRPPSGAPAGRKISIKGFEIEEASSRIEERRPLEDTISVTPEQAKEAGKKAESWEDLLKVVSMEPGESAAPRTAPIRKSADESAPPSDDDAGAPWKALLNKTRENEAALDAAPFSQAREDKAALDAAPFSQTVRSAPYAPQEKSQRPPVPKRITSEAPKLSSGILPTPGAAALQKELPAREASPPKELPIGEPASSPDQGRSKSGAVKRILPLELEKKSEKAGKKPEASDVPMFLKSASKIIALPEKKSPPGEGAGGDAPAQDSPDVSGGTEN